MRIGRQRFLATAFLTFGLAVSIPVSFAAGAKQAASATETGLDARGHLRAVAAGRGESFSYARLQQGVQVRVGQIVKNVIFYGPQTVRVNANLGENYWTAPSLAVIGKPQPVPFATSETADTLTLKSAALRVEISKRTGAVRFLDAAGKLYTEEKSDAPQTLKKVVVSGAPTFEAANRFTLRPDEAIYGLGFLGEDSSNRRGKELLLVQTNDLVWNDAARTLSIGPRRGGFPGMTAQRELDVVLVDGATGGGMEPAPVTRRIAYTGKPVTVRF